MKVSAITGSETAQTVGAVAANCGAAMLAETSAFSALLESITASSARQQAVGPVQPFRNDSIKNPSSNKTPSATAPKAADAAQASNDNASNDGGDVSPAADAGTASAPAASLEAKPPETTDKTPAKNVKNTANGKGNETAAAAQAVQAQPVKMEDLIKKFSLSDEQVQKLADALHTPVAELKQMRITATQNGQSTTLTLTAADGSKFDLAKMLNADKSNSQTTGASEAARKIADILKLDANQTKQMFSDLNVSKIEIKNATQIPAADMKAASDTASSANPVMENTVQTVSSAPVQPAAAPAQIPNEAPSAQTAPARESSGSQTVNTAQTAAKPALSVAEMSAVAAAQTAQSDNGQNTFSQNPGTGDQQPGTVETGKMAGVKESGQAASADFAAALSGTKTASGAQAAAKAGTSAPAAAPSATGDAAKAHADRVLGQIAEKASILQLPNATQTRISLNPKELGAVDIKLVMQDATVKASIVVESHAVKQVVEQNLDQLKNMLAGQGISVDGIQVSVDQRNSQSFDPRNSGWDNMVAPARESSNAAVAGNAKPAAGVFARRYAGASLVDITA